MKTFYDFRTVLFTFWPLVLLRVLVSQQTFDSSQCHRIRDLLKVGLGLAQRTACHTDAHRES